MLDHPRSAIAGLSLILKFGFDTIIILEILRFLYFAVLAGNCLFTPIFREFWGHISPNMVTHRSNPQKDHPCAETRRLSHKAWKWVQRFDLGVRSRKKGKDRTGQSKKRSHKVVIFRLFGEKPPLNRLKRKFAWRVTSQTWSRVQSFKMKFLGVTILPGVSHFAINFCMGLTTVQCDCAACDMISLSSVSVQDAQLSQRDRAAGCVIAFAKSRRLELGDNILRTL